MTTNQLQLGLDTFGDVTFDAEGQLLPQAQVIRNVIAEAVLADQLGLDFIGVGEHHRDDFAVSAPEVVLAAIAGQTRRIRLGSAVTVLSSDDPVRVFERFSTLDAVSGGQDTVGIRCPSHPVAMQLLQAFKEGKGGVAAPSANKFGNVSPTTAQHVHDEFGDDPRLAAILDGGSSQVGIESTILDMSRLATHGPVLLRPGHITAQQIADVIGVMPRQPDQAAPRASGTLESHYAPKAPVALLPTGDIEKTLAELKLRGRSAALIHYSPFVLSQPNVTLPAEPKGYAYGVYAALRAMDQQQVELILVEAPPSDDAWLGVNDRLRRAAFGSTGIIERFLQS